MCFCYTSHLKFGSGHGSGLWPFDGRWSAGGCRRDGHGQVPPEGEQGSHGGGGGSPLSLGIFKGYLWLKIMETFSGRRHRHNRTIYYSIYIYIHDGTNEHLVLWQILFKS
jgi:hypothetical protein